jgi:hypothetical protein
MMTGGQVKSECPGSTEIISGYGYLGPDTGYGYPSPTGIYIYIYTYIYVYMYIYIIYNIYV